MVRPLTREEQDIVEEHAWLPYHPAAVKLQMETRIDGFKHDSISLNELKRHLESAHNRQKLQQMGPNIVSIDQPMVRLRRAAQRRTASAEA